MKQQINTIREGLERATRYTMLEPDAQAVQQALTALSELEAMAGEPVALLVRKNSWNEGQWECGPPNSPEYGRQWADERMFVYAAPVAQHAAIERKDALLRQALDAVENVNTTMPFLVAHELRQAITKELAK